MPEKHRSLRLNPERTRELFLSGYNCAESMLLSACEELGIKNEYFPAAGSALGAGLSLTGDICGLATGGLMVIGLLYGRRTPFDSNDRTYYLGTEFLKGFKELRGSKLCLNISGKDLSLDEEYAAFEREKVEEKICAPLLVETVNLLNIILAEMKGSDN
ncbi:MAG: C_GCAxxG_C_C family protein [FCB group bacterium]|nr:C_GCAxxG_C_C family protein [FCB group bacterium]